MGTCSTVDCTEERVDACEYPVLRRGKLEACGEWICASCATPNVADGRLLCREHARVVTAALALVRPGFRLASGLWPKEIAFRALVRRERAYRAWARGLLVERMAAVGLRWKGDDLMKDEPVGEWVRSF